MKCYVCDTEITAANETDEHIIINAAGGRLKSKKLICKNCNSVFGENIDSILAKQLNNISNILMVNRHRGKPQPIIGENQSTGEKYFLDVGGKPRLYKPKIDETTDGDKTNISIIARSEKELREILNGYAKKYNHFDIDEGMKHAKLHEEYLDTPIKFQNNIGGNEVFRAVCKCAINFYIFSKGDASQIKHLIPYIKGEKDKEVVCMHYQDKIYDLDKEECSHVIHLVGKKEKHILYCYVDYFNTFKYLILLNDNYQGTDIINTYFFDLINTKKIQRDVKIDYDRNTLLDFFTNKEIIPFEKIKNSFDHTIAIGLNRQDKYHINELIGNAIQNSLGNHPDGVKITKVMIDETIEEIMGKIAPFLINKMKK